LKLATLETSAGLTVAAVIGDKFVDVCAVDSSLPRCLKGILASSDGLAKAAAAAKAGEQAGKFVTGRLRAPIQKPDKVICIGLNYRDHAKESGMEPPPEPVVFSKFSSAVVGPEDVVRLPKVSTQVDYEAELVVVIGRRGKNIPRLAAMSHVAGYMNGNDVSARDWQINKPGKQWLLGKTPDTFAPTGPYLVTADDVPNPGALSIALRLNGETMQNSSTQELIFGVDELVAYVSQIVTLESGDLIFTGTPPGVGMARKPPVFLKPGDVTEVEVAGLGVLRNSIQAE
jgi:2-keto-4-pentenoate hydratase/2-oxohepta-3-ene-1,7-dioic acid hydratase in catechol pathway